MDEIDLYSATSNAISTEQKQNEAFELIGLKKLHNDSQFSQIDGSGLAVAVIDSGINSQHPLLKDNYKYGYDFAEDDGTPDDTADHGTLVSGIIGATDQEIGMAPQVDLIGLKVGSEFLYEQAILDSLRWVLAHYQEYNIVAVNLSFGGGFYTSASQVGYYDTRYGLVQQLEQAGITVVASAGNSYYDSQYQNLEVPAIYSTLAAGAVWAENLGEREWYDGAIDYSTGADRIVSFSNRLNSDNMIFAPGAGSESTSSDGGLASADGTSFSAAHITGAVVLIQEAALEFAGRKFTPDEVAQIIRSTAQSIYDGDNEDDNVRNTNTNYLRLDVYNAVVATQAQGYREIAQYGASHSDLIANFGYDLKALAKHYRDSGAREGRSRDNFDEYRYIASNRDLIVSFKLDGEGATKHYLQNGYRESRSLTAFDPEQYLAANKDLISAYGYNTTEATRHYIQNGYSERRSTTFDASRYLASNVSLIRALNKDRSSATRHYIQNGYYEGRSTSSFDAKQYLASYTDLMAGFGVNLAAATAHFVDSGYDEGRSGDRFEEYRYIASYGDLIRGFGTNGEAATEHYLNYGIGENRSVTFDPFIYMALNPDIASGYGYNLWEATKHYINYGFAEGRKFS